MYVSSAVSKLCTFYNTFGKTRFEIEDSSPLEYYAV